MDTEICETCGKKRWEQIGTGAYQCACDCAVVLDTTIQVEVRQDDLQRGILALLDAAHRKDGDNTESLRPWSSDELREVAERLRISQPPVFTGRGVLA